MVGLVEHPKCCLDWLVDNRCVDEPKCMVTLE